MAIFTREQYSRSQTVDLETAIAEAVEAVLSRDFPGPAGEGTIRIEEFFEDWASMADNFIDPSAAVMPNDELRYGPSHPTPRALEDTWEPKGGAGFILVELSEASREFEVAVLTGTAASRIALKAGIETAFQEQNGLMVARYAGQAGAAVTAPGDRMGVVVQEMPGYWNLPCRLTLLASRKIDDSGTAAQGRAEARFRIRAEAPHVMLQPMQPFRLKLDVFESDAQGNTLGRLD